MTLTYGSGSALSSELGGERILFVVPELSAAIVGTARRVILGREGSNRPSGVVRSFAFDELRGVELIPSETGPGRISLQLGLLYSTGLSIIVQRRDLAVAEQAVRIARAKIAGVSRDTREAGTGSTKRRWITSATIPIQSIECG